MENMVIERKCEETGWEGGGKNLVLPPVILHAM